LRRALHLTLLTIGRNVIEGGVAITAAVAAGSVALLGFGVDSFVESASGGVMLWRNLAPPRLLTSRRNRKRPTMRTESTAERARRGERSADPRKARGPEQSVRK
jgi:hypothetical protein